LTQSPFIGQNAFHEKIIGLSDIARLDLNLAATFLAIWNVRGVGKGGGDQFSSLSRLNSTQ
jgi:hypothetical protein